MQQGKKESIFKKRLFILFLISASVGVFNILYLPVVYYVPFQTAFQLTNSQMGSLLAYYAVLAVPGYLMGGWLCDKFSAKLLLVISNIGTALMGFWMATIPGYESLKIIFFCLSITIGLFNWSPFVKCIRVLGDHKEQGKLFGLSSSFDGMISAGLSLLFVAVFGKIIGTAGGFRMVILAYSSFSLIIGILLMVFYDYKLYSKQNGASGKEEINFSTVIQVAKLPVTWIIAGLTFGAYTISTALGYISPYLNEVYLMPVAWATAFGAITRYGIKIVATPLGGVIRDKIGKTAPLVFMTAIPGILVVVSLFFIPKDPKYFIITVIVALVLIFIYRISGNVTSTPLAEARVPIHIAGTVVGLSSMFGYSTDLFLPRLCGYFLDTYGTKGYHYIFAIIMAGFTIMLISAICLSRLMNSIYKKDERESV